jgi:outer membrane receptor for ferrienterochelin and colicins
MKFLQNIIKTRKYGLVVAMVSCFTSHLLAQQGSITGKITSKGIALEFATVTISNLNRGTLSDSAGHYQIKNLGAGTYVVSASYVGYEKLEKQVIVENNEVHLVDFELIDGTQTLADVVITGTMKEVSRMQSPVAVEVYTPVFFKKNPTPNIYEALQSVNGVRPQINCNVCNTGDIHINGMEGPYTMVLIDGMPIVSSLSTVYGLSGIPNALVDRIEVVKGPASSLYGSESVGGLINIITKKASSTPRFTVDLFNTSWKELNADLGFKVNVGKKSSALTGVNYFNFQNAVDRNQDNFTDLTLQHRISIFQKWNFDLRNNSQLSLAGRYMYEDRWGGDMRWSKTHRGGDNIYGESIYTSRYEILGNYQWPSIEKIKLSFSYNSHNQNSVYGTTIYTALQNISFLQCTWDKKTDKHNLLSGTALRHTFYDDNTPATASPDILFPSNKVQHTWLPGLFLQDEIEFKKSQTLLLGMRHDYNTHHGHIFTPRIAYKKNMGQESVIRLNGGTGYRVVNLFTEDHAALTGARIVEIKSKLKPERSYNVNVNYVKKYFLIGGTFIGLDATAFYTYYNNKIIGDYDTDPNKIIYDNLLGHAISKGVSLNTDLAFASGLKILAGATLMANTITQNNLTSQQILTEKFTGVWAVSYKIVKSKMAIDYTGNVYSPMRLPLLSDLDPRKPNSPWWSIQNIQVAYSGIKKIEIYGGIKNLLNFTPAKQNPFIIARTHDPFDKEVNYDTQGKIIATSANPYALSFDPTYVYAPMQGARLFFGLRYQIL